MIIVVCTDDKNLMGLAREATDRNKAVFGGSYQIFAEPLPDLGTRENLFIIAHGSFQGAGGVPAIGDHDIERAFELNGVELYQNISTIFPDNYIGNIYIDACKSADHDNYTFSFCEVFHSQINPFYDSDVFGRNGTVRGRIPTPRSRGWVKVEADVQAL